MNTYRKTGKIASILLLVVFIFAAAQPTRTYSPYGSSHATFQSHLENLALHVTPDWQTSFFHVKSPLIGTTWTPFLKNLISESIRVADALDISIHQFSYFFITPTINAP